MGGGCSLGSGSPGRSSKSILGIAAWFVPLVDVALRALKANSRFCWVGPARSPRFSSSPPSGFSVSDVLCFFVVCRRAPAGTSAWFRQLVQCATCCKPRGNVRAADTRYGSRNSFCFVVAALMWRVPMFMGPHSSRFCLQAMKPTRTSSETFHTWPQTTPRSSNAAAPTSGSNLPPQPPPPPPPPACVQQTPAHVQLVSVCTFLSWLPATCWVIAQLVLTPDG